MKPMSLSGKSSSSDVGHGETLQLVPVQNFRIHGRIARHQARHTDLDLTGGACGGRDDPFTLIGEGLLGTPLEADWLRS